MNPGAVDLAIAAAVLVCVSLLVWIAHGLVRDSLARYRAVFTETARVRMSEFFLFVDVNQLWVAHVAVIGILAAACGWFARSWAFAAAGAEVVVSDLNLAAAKQTAALIAERGGLAHAYQLDVADEAAVIAHAEAVTAAHGVPDVLVNNAGVAQAGRFLATPSQDFRRVLDINLFGVVHGCRAFGPAMARRGLGGHIVNLSSMAAYTPQQGMGAYATSKSAVFMFSDCLRAELASTGVGVSTICPGVVHTNIVRNTTVSGLPDDEAARKVAMVDRAYRLRRYSAAKVAKQIVKAVTKDKAVVPVTPEARLQYLFSRLSPGAARLAARAVALD